MFIEHLLSEEMKMGKEKQVTLAEITSHSIFLNRFAGPHDHLCCW